MTGKELKALLADLPDASATVAVHIGNVCKPVNCAPPDTLHEFSRLRVWGGRAMTSTFTPRRAARTRRSMITMSWARSNAEATCV
jgi:hypothetical protein